MKATVKITGSLRKNIVNVRLVKTAVASTALAVERGAKQRAPVDTGNLRSSMQVEFLDSGFKARITTGNTFRGNDNIGYAHYQEFGTKFMKAQPYLGPAAEQERKAFIQKLKRAIII